MFPVQFDNSEFAVSNYTDLLFHQFGNKIAVIRCLALPDVVDYFIDFYEDRKAHGMIAEKPNSIYQKGGYTKKDVEKNILSNPFKCFEDMRFLMRCKDVETIEVNPIIFRKLTREDWLHIIRVCDKSLEEYYARFQK